MGLTERPEDIWKVLRNGASYAVTLSLQVTVCVPHARTDAAPMQTTAEPQPREVGAWGSCSSACGDGTRARSVACSSGNATDCPVPAPEASEGCHDLSGCKWVLGAWSACSAHCGEGAQNRSVACASGADADCAAPRPLGTARCRSTEGCTWQAGPWAECSSTCGQGQQERNVSCSSGSPEDCQGQLPVATWPCRGISDCAWTTSEWSACSQPCGPGVRGREVRCLSGNDTDCTVGAAGTRPLDQQGCHGGEDGTCTWEVGAWSACQPESCGGTGTRKRTVACPSALGDSGCAGASRPPGLEACVSTATCEWRAGPWSGCDEACGWREETRDVSCGLRGVAEEACDGAPPDATRECHSLSGCGWAPGNWSSCSATCGPGVQTRTPECLGTDCQEFPRPSTERACTGEGPCEWLAAAWSPCDAECGDGLQLRDVSCQGGIEEVCEPQSRPAERRECQGTTNCQWFASGWSVCSAPCGDGTETRRVECQGASEELCASHPRPAEWRPCSETLGCAWQTSSWSTCSETCGNGTQSRSVWCPGESCPGDAPVGAQACESRTGCGWSTMPWSECGEGCGAGVQRRNASCLGGAGACEGPGPPLWQHCQGTAACTWEASAWSGCSASCGQGTRIREVLCRGGDATACGERPPAVEACRNTSLCAWRASAWSSCGGACEAMTREVACPSGRAADCPGQAPFAAKPCDLAACSATTSGAAAVTFELVLTLPSWPTPAVLETLIASTRETMAHSMGLPLERVTVTVVESDEVASGRRLAGVVLKLLVSVENAGLGMVAMVASSAVRGQLATAVIQGIAEDVAAAGLEAGFDTTALSAVVAEPRDGPGANDVATATASTTAAPTRTTTGPASAAADADGGLVVLPGAGVPGGSGTSSSAEGPSTSPAEQAVAAASADSDLTTIAIGSLGAAFVVVLLCLPLRSYLKALAAGKVGRSQIASSASVGSQEKQKPPMAGLAASEVWEAAAQPRPTDGIGTPDPNRRN